MSCRIAAVVLCAGLVASGCSSSEAPAQAGGGGGPPPAAVQLAAVETGSLTTGWRFLGRVQAALEAEVAAAVDGHVISVAVREGDHVEARQLLMALDAAETRAQLAGVKAQLAGTETELALAKRQYERIKDLQYPTISEPERERYQLAVDIKAALLAVQQAEAQRLEVRLRQHTVRAPFAGVVRARHVDPGDWVSVGRTAVERVARDHREVPVGGSARLGSELAVGQTAALIGQAEVAAEVVGIVPALDDSTRTMRARLVPKERPAWLIAGMPIDVEFQVELGSSGVIVSRDALVTGPVDVRVIKAVDGKAAPVVVEVIATADGRALVRGEGLAAGDRVVVRGNERLRPGQPLNAAD